MSLNVFCRWPKWVLILNCNSVNIYIITTTFMSYFCVYRSPITITLYISLLPISTWLSNTAFSCHFYNFPNPNKEQIVIIVLTFILCFDSIKKPILLISHRRFYVASLTKSGKKLPFSFDAISCNFFCHFCCCPQQSIPSVTNSQVRWY